MTVPRETLLIFTYQFFCPYFLSLHYTFAPGNSRGLYLSTFYLQLYISDGKGTHFMSSLREENHVKNQRDAFSVFQYPHDP